MEEARHEIGYAERPGRDVVVPWLLALGAPAVHLLVLALRYGLVRPACGGGWARVLLELVAALGLAAAATPGALAWRTLGRAGLWAEADEPGREGSVHLLLQLAVLTSAVFTLLALATWIPSWVVSPCHG